MCNVDQILSIHCAYTHTKSYILEHSKPLLVNIHIFHNSIPSMSLYIPLATISLQIKFIQRPKPIGRNERTPLYSAKWQTFRTFLRRLRAPGCVFFCFLPFLSPFASMNFAFNFIWLSAPIVGQTHSPNQ